MRVLMSCRPLYGHYAPMVALAKALLEVGHQVRFATGEPLLATIRADGFETAKAGLSAQEITDLRAADPVLAGAAATGMAIAFFSRSFAGFEVPPRVEDLTRIVHDWSPDLLVHEMSEFAGPLVAALEGLPAVNHSYGPLVEAHVMEAAGATAAEHWLDRGLPAPDRGGMYGHLYLDIAPPSLQFPYISTVPSVQPLRPVPLPGGNSQASPWLSQLGPQPVVAVTFGTVFNNRLDLYRVVIDALGDTDLQVVIASGRSEAAKGLGSLPSNVQLHEWVPWAELIARSSVVVTHGGAGSSLGPLSAGIPLVMIPLAADHFKNTVLVSATGAAVALDAGALTPSQLRDAVSTALGESARTAAQRIAEEIGRMPSPEEVVPILANLR